jgi:KAP family P-loop domain
MRRNQPGGAFAILSRRARAHVTEDEFELRMREWLSWYRASGLGDEKTVFATRPVIAMLQQAAQLAANTIGEPVIHARHLVATLLSLGNDTGAHRFLSFLGSSVRALRFELQHWVHTSVAAGLPDDVSAWREFLGGTPAELDDGAIIGPAAYIDDQRQVEDRLGFRRDANAFGTLIAAKNISPPLSVGVFGDWGAGKTFFMDMIYKSVEANAAAARGGTSTSFVSHIAQIRFNAWHYTEANLWASLVDNIFRGIFEYLRPDSADEKAIRDQRNDLMSQIDAATASGCNCNRRSSRPASRAISPHVIWRRSAREARVPPQQCAASSPRRHGRTRRSTAVRKMSCRRR